jgi:hypothetical protein
MHNSMRLTLAAILLLSPCVALAQGETQAKPDAGTASTKVRPMPAKPDPQPYELTVTVRESGSGKAGREKTYKMTGFADDQDFWGVRLRDSDRLPYMGEKGREYFDVGTNIDAQHAKRRGETVALNLSVTSSSLSPGSSSAAKVDGVNLPEVMQWSVGVDVSLIPGKPAIVYSVTDATTGHKVEIEATVQLPSPQ